MRTTRPRHPSILVGLVLLLPCLMGVTYRWVDAQGQVHLTDTPPPAGVAYQTVSTPSHAPAPAPAAAKPVAAAPATAPVPQQDPRPAAAAAASRADGRCIDALFQLELLVGKYKVYKGPDDARIYLDDRDRPAEIERLTRERDASCSTDPKLRGSQERRAAQLFQSLHPDCREAREKLANLQRPSARSSPGDIEEQREYVRNFCPDIAGAGDRTDLWRADWVWQWHKD
jgi:hypothetical protein